MFHAYNFLGSIFYIDLPFDDLNTGTIYPSDMTGNDSRDDASNSEDSFPHGNHYDSRPNIFIDRGQKVSSDIFLGIRTNVDEDEEPQFTEGRLPSLHVSHSNLSAGGQTIGLDHGCPPVTFDANSSLASFGDVRHERSVYV